MQRRLAPIFCACGCGVESLKYGRLTDDTNDRLSHLAISFPVEDYYGAGAGPIASTFNGPRCAPIDDVLRRVQERIDPAAPRTGHAGGRQFEVERLPVCIRDQGKR